MSFFEYDEGASSSLFNQYSQAPKSRRRGNATTRSAQLRAMGIRLCCYLNCEGVGVAIIGGPQGHGTVVKLPVECDTMEEVLILIQSRLKLDARMLYASELYDVHGNPIIDVEQLAQLSLVDAPIIVGCGEPFDATRIPQDLVEFHREGGGRKGPQKVHTELKAKREQALREKAEKVRNAGHGINSEAAAVARLQNVEQNREHVNNMRHRYMESLLIRAAQQEDLMHSVKSNIELHKMEAQESRARQEEKKQERMLTLAAERRAQKEENARLRAMALEKRRAQASKVRTDSPKRIKGGSSSRAKSARPSMSHSLEVLA